MASLSEPGALDEAQNMQQVLAWVMRDASAAAGGSAMVPEDSDGSSLPDVLGGAYDLDPADADLAIALEAEVRELVTLIYGVCSTCTVRYLRVIVILLYHA